MINSDTGKYCRAISINFALKILKTTINLPPRDILIRNTGNTHTHTQQKYLNYHSNPSI